MGLTMGAELHPEERGVRDGRPRIRSAAREKVPLMGKRGRTSNPFLGSRSAVVRGEKERTTIGRRPKRKRRVVKAQWGGVKIKRGKTELRKSSQWQSRMAEPGALVLKEVARRGGWQKKGQPGLGSTPVRYLTNKEKATLVCRPF